MSEEIVAIVQPVSFEATVEPIVNEVTFAFPGPQGPAGPEGPPGSGAAHYTHVQAIASTFWVINHNLGFQPNVAVIVDGEDISDGVLVAHTNINEATVTSNVAISGEAECS